MNGSKSTFRWADVCFLALLAACPPLATDMYLPAIPMIADTWHVPISTVNLSLVLWFVGFSVALLISGPLSDRHGRKPVLYGGLVLFIAASLGCAASVNVQMLIITRVLQGIGAGGPSAMCLAICRDRYDGDLRKKVLATVSVLLTLAPMISPTIGTQLLIYFHWQVIFIMQAMIGVVILLLSLMQHESLSHRSNTPLLKMLGRYLPLFHNHQYLRMTLALGALIGPHLAYVAFAPIVYIDLFELSNQTFSLLFALNAALYMTGALISTPVSKRLGDHTMLSLSIAGIFLGGIGIVLTGHMNPATFTVFMALITVSFGMTRPISQHIILDQVHTDVGAASSMLVFYQFMVGAICMTIASQHWHKPIAAFGILAMLVAVVVGWIWYRLLKRLGQHS